MATMATVFLRGLRSSFPAARSCGLTCACPLRCINSTWPITIDHRSSFHTSAFVLGGRKRSEWRQDRVPAHTRLRLDKPEKIKVRKAFGGHKKSKGIKIKTGVYSCNSLDVELECPILKVVHNTANDNFNKRGVMVKGTIVEIDSHPLKTWYSTHLKKEDQKTEIKATLDQLLPFMEIGKLYAKITTRPGQVGACNGYILEGDELENLLNAREDLRLTQENKSVAQ